MAKYDKCVYGVKEPTSINQLNDEYMTAFLKAKIAEGSITRNEVEEYKKKKNSDIAKKEKEKKKTLSKIERSHIERKLFAEFFMKDIAAKEKKKIDFDAELDALING